MIFHHPWFRREGLFFKPIAFMGWLLFVAGIIFSVYVFIAIDQKSHSASDTLMNFAFNFLLIACGYSLVGYLTSRDKEG